MPSKKSYKVSRVWGNSPTFGNYGHGKARLTMLAIKAQCDGTKIMLPQTEKFPVGQVIVVFAEGFEEHEVGVLT